MAALGLDFAHVLRQKNQAKLCSSSTLKRGSVFLIFFRWQVEATKPVFFEAWSTPSLGHDRPGVIDAGAPELLIGTIMVWCPTWCASNRGVALPPTWLSSVATVIKWKMHLAISRSQIGWGSLHGPHAWHRSRSERNAQAG